MVQEPLCIILSYYENGSLLSFLRSDAMISLKLKIRIMNDIASGVSHLHQEGIIHRDLAGFLVELFSYYS